MLQILESYFNATEDCFLCDSGWYEPFTEDVGRLFRRLQREHGRCVSRVYVDGPDGQSWPQGWVFQKRRRYDGARSPSDKYSVQTWVSMRHVMKESA